LTLRLGHDGSATRRIVLFLATGRAAPPARPRDTARIFTLGGAVPV